MVRTHKPVNEYIQQQKTPVFLLFKTTLAMQGCQLGCMVSANIEERSDSSPIIPHNHIGLASQGSRKERPIALQLVISTYSHPGVSKHSLLLQLVHFWVSEPR